jgi:hypothetical protein
MFSFLGTLRPLLVLIPVGATVALAATFLPFEEKVASNEGCAASTERPCYDQGTAKKVKIAKGSSGAQTFASCADDGEQGVRGEVGIETDVCKLETVSYCARGNSENFVREFTGTCQNVEPEPEIKEVSISGIFINALTKEPLSGVRVWDPAIGIGTALDESNEQGEFSFVSDTTAVTDSNTLYTSYATGCYFQNWGFTSIDRNPDQSLRLLAILFDFIPGDLEIDPLTSVDVEMGEVPLWPATTLVINSDVPVNATISYPEENKELSTTRLSTEHKVWNAIPLEHPTTVQLTDANGQEYTSPEITLPISNGCAAPRLTFADGELSW